MAKVGGSIKQLTLNGRIFSVKADADITRALPSNNKVEMNGDRSATLVQVIAPWALNEWKISVDNNNGDIEYIRDLTKLPDFFPITYTLADGTVQSCVGQIVDVSEIKTMNNELTISLMGPGQIEK